MPMIGQKPIYAVQKLGKTYRARIIHRVLGYRTLEGIPVVRFERCWQLLHAEGELAKFVKLVRKKERGIFIFEGKTKQAKFRSLPFVKEWEISLRLYPTFVPYGI